MVDNTAGETGANASASTKGEVAADESCRPETAQQVSACCCATTRCDPDSWESDWCIGQESLAQQFIRASDVACHPPQTAAFAASSASPTPNATTRFMTTFL